MTFEEKLQGLLIALKRQGKKRIEIDCEGAIAPERAVELASAEMRIIWDGPFDVKVVGDKVIVELP